MLYECVLLLTNFTMKDDYVYLDEATLMLYLEKYNQKLDRKDYEIMAAVIMKNFFEIETGMKCIAGFKVKAKYLKEYEKRGSNKFTPEETKDLIENHTEEND